MGTLLKRVRSLSAFLAYRGATHRYFDLAPARQPAVQSYLLTYRRKIQANLHKYPNLRPPVNLGHDQILSKRCQSGDQQ